MALILDALVQFAQLLLVLSVAPLLTGYIRKVKAQLLRRRGPPLLQPYRDLLKLIRKEAVLAHNASWVFRVTPYIVFATTLTAAALVPTFATGLVLSSAADLIAIVALLGTARFFLALAGLDIGTSFGGIGSSREMMIASLAEPAMLMIVFTLSLLAGSTQLSSVSTFMQGPDVGLRVSLAMSLVALIMVAIAENARIPVDNPATHLELTMIHEAMILEYSGRHLAVIEAAASLKLLLYFSLIACMFAPWGLATSGQGFTAFAIGLGSYVASEADAAGALAGNWGPVVWQASLAAERDGAVTSAVTVVLDDAHESRPLLAFVMTEPACQRQGIGRWLIGESIRRLDQMGVKELHLAVTRGNPAFALYQRLGFQIVPTT